jgi:tRNA threonylcarbamoyladenosine biosynthesis protein TsaB
MKILALDLAAGNCSVALWQHGELIGREAPAVRGHGAQLLSMVDAVLGDAGIGLPALDAIAFGRGPGAFTGLRLAASVTQGLAFAAGLPVIPVSDLRALAQQLVAAPVAAGHVLVCHDARMGEVYWAGFSNVDGHARADTAEAVARPEAVIAPARSWLGSAAAAGVGSGFAVYPALAEFGARLAPLTAELRPRAHEIALLAAFDGPVAAVAPELAVPVYLRNDVTSAPKPGAGGPRDAPAL